MALEPSPEAALCREVLAEARRTADEILHRAREVANAEFAEAHREAESARESTMNLARLEAARRREVILSTVAVEVNRRRAALIEEWLESIRTEVTSRLRTDTEDGIASLAHRAIAAIVGCASQDVIVQISKTDLERIGDQLRARIGAAMDAGAGEWTLASDPEVAPGDVRVQSTNGRRTWDNARMARLERMWPRIRNELASQAGIAGVPDPDRKA